jgi:hypothetical protein
MAESSFLDKIFHSIPGKIFIVITQTVLSSLLLLLTFTIRSHGDISLLKYSIVLVVGLLAGFAARRILAANTWTLKILTALFSSALSLAVISILSGGFLGIKLTFRFDQAPDWSGLIQLGISAVGSLLVVTAFQSSVKVKDPPAPRATAITSTRKDSKPGLIRWPIKIGRPQVSKNSQKTSASTRIKKDLPALAVQKKPNKNASLQNVAVGSAPKTSINKPSKRKNRVKSKEFKEIKLVGEIEHTCPYCLDKVEPKDPRGVKVCPICKTHHHADCWGITGACQIPHSQEKS